MRYIRLFILTLFITLPVFGENKDYFFEQVSSDVGFSFNAVNSIVEDNYGFVWFGCSNGLYYYNTAQFTKYNFDPHKNDSPPSNIITNLYKDSIGRIWICTDNGICYFNELSNSFIRLHLKESNNYLNSVKVSSIVQYSNNKYLIVINMQLYFFNMDDLVLRKVKIGEDTADISYLGRNEDNRIYVGNTSGQVFINTTSISEFRLIYHSQSGAINTLSYINNSIWLAVENSGIEVVSIDGEFKTRYRKEYSGSKHITNNWVRKIITRENGEIWIGTYEGITVINAEGNHTIKHTPYNGLPHNSIYELYLDRNDCIWIGTWSGGLAYYSDLNYKFPHVIITKNNVPISNSVISSFTEDKNGNILVGSETSGLISFNPDKNIFVDIEPKVNFPIYRIKSLSTDTYGRHWFGTFKEGLWYMDENRLKMVESDLDRNIISSLLPVENGVWIGTRLNGLKFYNINNGTVEHFLANDDKIGSISSNMIWDIVQDSKGNIWICSNFGLTVKYKNASDFERYYTNENANSLSRNYSYTITEDRNGDMWIGTSGGGIDIFDQESKTFKKFRLNAAINNADVYCIINDQQGNMWFSSNQGIYMYDTKTSTLENFTEHDDLLGSRYVPNSGLINSSGKLFFGGANGFNIIDPKVVIKNKIAPNVYVSNLFINNRPFNEQDIRFLNSKFPAGIESLGLNYDQNSLSFEIVANNFIKTAKNRFRYRLINYIDEWNEIEHGSLVSFTKIPPGNYILQLLAANNDGVWSKTPKEIQIKIYPPFWRTWYAYIFYFVLLATILIVVFSIRKKIIKERYKHAADEFLFSEKVKFFTNVSHEFRTPLTLILSPLNNLMKKFIHDPGTMDHIKIIKRNADRLLRLTNQILDFRLIELNKVKLKLEKEEIVSLCRNVYNCFEYQITEKEINCIFTSTFKSLHLPIDPEKIEKVIYNLLSNALKFSLEKGQIILSLEQKTLMENSYSDVFCTGNKFFGESLEIKVKDNGKGIKADILPHIFERFVVDNENDEMGTGIGLHICQEYIHLHNGNILVTSEKGNGATFVINIPITSNYNFEQEEIIIQYHFDQIQESNHDQSIHTNLPKKNKIVLFAEDNDELRFYFKKLLSSKYKVLTAKNGQQAFEIAYEIIPDIIISDVLMPGMGGMELISKIRETKKTKHIPIILLTALSDDKYKIESMNKGANAFITKPVEEEFLFARIENIFSIRETVKQKYEDNKNKAFSSSHINESFIEKAEKFVDENLQNPSFEIVKLASMLNVSRSSFHRKLKAAVNLSPSEFIRDIRLKNAVELIKKDTLNMDEITIIVGFNSQSYFIRSFKAKYGETPTAFKAKLSRDTDA